MTKLENWSVGCVDYSPYLAPELLETCLRGGVYNHLRHSDGKNVRTSRIIRVEGRTIYTYSGTAYQLGKINPQYRKFLKETCPDWDYRKPLRAWDA